MIRKKLIAIAVTLTVLFASVSAIGQSVIMSELEAAQYYINRAAHGGYQSKVYDVEPEHFSVTGNEMYFVDKIAVDPADVRKVAVEYADVPIEYEHLDRISDAAVESLAEWGYANVYLIIGDRSHNFSLTTKSKKSGRKRILKIRVGSDEKLSGHVFKIQLGPASR